MNDIIPKIVRNDMRDIFLGSVCYNKRITDKIIATQRATQQINIFV